MTSPPIVVRDVVVVGASVLDLPVRRDLPPGHVRGFDARTGQLRWIFHAIPQAGEFGNETWEQESWKTTGSTNVWAPMSADEDLGYVYLPFSTPSNDFYGGNRHGDNLFAESLSSASTPRPARESGTTRSCTTACGTTTCRPPRTSPTSRVDGQRVKAVAQVTKQGFVFVFDRVTGRPSGPSRSGRCRQSKVPGENSVSDPAVPHEASARRPPGRDGRGRDRLHAGAAPEGAGDPRALRLGPALHAAERARDDLPAGRRRRMPAGRAPRSIPRPGGFTSPRAPCRS